MLSEKRKVAILEQYVESEATSTDYSGEMSFYSYVKQGQTKEVRERLRNDSFAMNTKKKLSADPIQSIRYHFVVTAGLLARFCIEGGMESNQAYEMSDYYILKADRLNSLKELCALHKVMCLDYAEQMETIRKKKIFSKPVVKSIDYIYSHLHCRITVAEVAAYVGLNENYFSRLFSGEVGISVSRYILQRKLEVAQNMLKYSDYSCSQISELLCFASQSHFIEKFRKEYGMTPLHYRNRYHSDMGLKEE